MDPNAYLDRISYRGAVTPTADLLHALHVAHLLTTPFENLSIHWGEPIVLDDRLLFEKIVTRRRGGFCYELNGLFGALLRHLGFEVAMLSAAVLAADGTPGPDFDHMVLMVVLEERWLVDVGFGDLFREPLLLDSRHEQAQGDRTYRLTRKDGRFHLIQRRGQGPWENQYRFTLQPYEYADFATMCHYHQTSPASHFTRRRTCSRATPDGRVTLSDLRLIETINGKRQERELPDETAWTEALRTHFGIVRSG